MESRSMREITLEEDKQIGLETLKYFADYCRKNDLTFFIAYGTLLGAVRHKGFIPWDDDIDTWMPRADYDRLLGMADSIGQGKYVLNAIETNPQFLTPFAKLTRRDTVLLPSRFTTGFLYGASIDIFPLDEIGTGEDMAAAKAELASIQGEHLSKIQKYHHYSGGHELKGLKKLAKKAIYSISSALYGPLSDNIRRYPRALVGRADDSGFVTTISGTTIYKKEWFQNTVELPFEDAFFCAPAGYDEILRQRYGDYMTPPPEKERVIPHIFKAYYLDD